MDVHKLRDDVWLRIEGGYPLRNLGLASDYAG